MSQPKGFADPLEAMLAVAVCLADLTIVDPDGQTLLEPRLFIGDDGVGGVLDCCYTDESGRHPLMRIEAGGETPTDGIPIAPSKQGCVSITETIRVTYTTCFQRLSKSGATITDPDALCYSRELVQARWDAIRSIRCCADPRMRFVSASPVADDRCAGFQLDLLAVLSVCGCAE